MKRLMVAVILFVIGFAGYATGEDLMEKDLRILADQYTAAAGYGETQSFASHFRSYMIGSNRLDAAAEQQRRLYRFTFDTAITGFDTAGDKRSYVMTSANYESKKNGKALAKGKITATYSVEHGKLVLVMVRFSDDVVRYSDAEKSVESKQQEKGKETMPFAVPNLMPDFGAEKAREREI
jgi:hypothetical protein